MHARARGQQRVGALGPSDERHDQLGDIGFGERAKCTGFNVDEPAGGFPEAADQAEGEFLISIAAENGEIVQAEPGVDPSRTGLAQRGGDARRDGAQIQEQPGYREIRDVKLRGHVEHARGRCIDPYVVPLAELMLGKECVQQAHADGWRGVMPGAFRS